MNMRKLSINKACVLLGTLLLLAVGAVCTAVHLLTQNITAVRCVFLFSLFVLLCVICFVALIRRKLVRFSDAFCGQMDDIIAYFLLFLHTCVLLADYESKQNFYSTESTILHWKLPSGESNRMLIS